ncbi:MAG: hypothetical protein ACYTG0_18665 [Planctomycetota bacterium]|jgi:hypothetical protein
MGVMRFVVESDRITKETVEQAYLAGFDRIPWQVRARYADGELRLERDTSDSAALHVPWQVEGHGQVTLSTPTLMERARPYHLSLELARGKIGQLRNQLAEWQMVGLDVPLEVVERVEEALGYFAQSAVIDHASTRSVRLADDAVQMALDAADRLAACYAEQALAARQRASPRLGTLWGVHLGRSLPDDAIAQPLRHAFNSAIVPITWREIETSEGHFCWDLPDRQIQWCRERGLKVFAGPVLHFDREALPGWLALYENDFESLTSVASQFLEAVVTRYRGSVDVWQCAGRVNAVDLFARSPERNVRLAARAVELSRALDAKTPLFVSFDQPWAEYMSRQGMDFPPVHSADALIRANLGLTGLTLDVNVGYHPGGSMLRDPLEFSQHLDYWSLLSVPMFVAVTVPSASDFDPLARRPASLSAGSWTPESQENWATRYLPLLLAKPYVHGVLWNQLRDFESHEFPYGGLFDLKKQAKPALGRLTAIRRAYLK